MGRRVAVPTWTARGTAALPEPQLGGPPGRKGGGGGHTGGQRLGALALCSTRVRRSFRFVAFLGTTTCVYLLNVTALEGWEGGR